MRHRLLWAAGTSALVVPALLFAQQRPAPSPRRPAPHPVQRPAARPLMAQFAGPHREGSWELGVSAAGLYTDKNFERDGTNHFYPAAAATLGYNLTEHWEIGVRALGATRTSATMLQGSAGLTWTANLNALVSPFLTAGAAYTKSSGSNTNGYTTDPVGAYGGIGLRFMIGPKVALRIEAGTQFDPLKERSGVTPFNSSGGIGIAYFAGGGPGPDSDGDGVPDKYDRCPNTPRGAVIDARGCPIDGDHDGVPDGIDRCANTPAGVRVDALGCPVDSDSDGVPDVQDRCASTPAGVHVDANGCPVDSDSDGVPDYLDRCSDTPRGAPVDANGCPKDSDGDGVADYLDHCPSTPASARPVDANGCPVDSDHDGVPDYLDRCPNTAANAPVDANGCPLERDSDGDGVPDVRDRCPATAHGLRVDADGCPYAELPAINASLVLQNVTFRVNRAVLLRAAMADLDKIATAIRATPNSRWEIGGFTSSLGRPASNLRLSQQRADAVKTYLISRGVPASSLAAVGYGAQHPIASNRTARGRRLNMRVQIKRLE